MKSIKSIFSSIWFAKGEKVFGGKDTIIICNQKTGKIETYEKVSETIHEGIIIKDDSTVDVDPAEIYGANGFKKATWFNETVNKQTEDVEQMVADGFSQSEAETF